MAKLPRGDVLFTYQDITDDYEGPDVEHCRRNGLRMFRLTLSLGGVVRFRAIRVSPDMIESLGDNLPAWLEERAREYALPTEPVKE